MNGVAVITSALLAVSALGAGCADAAGPGKPASGMIAGGAGSRGPLGGVAGIAGAMDASAAPDASQDAAGAPTVGAAGGTVPPDASQGTADAGPTSGTDAASLDTARCPAVPKCDAAPPDPGPKRAWRNKAPAGVANHQGHDLFLTPGDRQWVIANFRYGLPLFDTALIDEEIDIYLLRACGAAWEEVGSARTTATASHPDVDGVTDEPGRLFFEIPADKKLVPGRHRLRLVVAGDLSAAEVVIEVVSPGAQLFVADVDGTLTTSEDAQAISLFTGAVPAENQGAPQALALLALKGYRPLYLTARPEWLTTNTRDWLTAKGFPPGIVHTTVSAATTSGAAATTYKSEELARLAGQGLRSSFALGNTASDADAYNDAGIQPLTHRIFYQYTDTAWNGRRIDDYGSLSSEWEALPPVCR